MYARTESGSFIRLARNDPIRKQKNLTMRPRENARFVRVFLLLCDGAGLISVL